MGSPGEYKAKDDTATVFTGIEHRVEVERRRFPPAAVNVPLHNCSRNGPEASWCSRVAWIGLR